MVSSNEPPDPPVKRLNVSQTLIDLIEKQYPGTLIRDGDEYDWTTADGSIIRLSVRSASEVPTKPVDPS